MANANLKTISPNRHIDPDGPLADQVNALLSYLNNPPQNPRLVTVSPKLAGYILAQHNPGNRRMSTSVVARYADNMVAGRWMLSGETISFCRSKKLRDGQHRLAACVASGVPFDVFVAYGIDEDAFMVINTGRKRSGGDTFKVKGVPNSDASAKATRWVEILTSGNPTDRGAIIENRDLFAKYQTLDQPLFDACVSEALTLCRGIRYMVPYPLAAMLYLYRGKHSAAMTKFRDDVLHSKGNAGACLSILASRHRHSGGRVHENIRNGLLILTLNGYVAGKRVTKDKLDTWADAYALNMKSGFPTLDI